MLSTELASLAGVTVRTLRHYHQVGILPEPERGANGYRRYGVHDLIRVLRIRRLAALGVGLEEMPALLDEPSTVRADAAGQAHPAAADALLERLDAELASQAERIAGQREVIAQLRGQSAPLDMPPELARFLVAMSGVAPSAEMARMDRDQIVLLAHLAGETGMPHLVGFYERMSEPDVLPALIRISSAFEGLDAATTDDELDAFVDDFVTSLDPVLRPLWAEHPDLDLSRATPLLAEYSASTLTEAQQRALERVGERLDALSPPTI